MTGTYGTKLTGTFLGTTILTVKATDLDEKNVVSKDGYGDVGYFLPPDSNFGVRRETGEVFVKNEGLDREFSNEYTINVRRISNEE